MLLQIKDADKMRFTTKGNFLEILTLRHGFT